MSQKPEFKNSKLETTVVGSYPVKIGTQEMLRQYYFGRDSYYDAIKNAVKDQENAGIEIISDGQVRGDVVSIAASCCHGITRGSRPKIIDELKPKDNVIAEDMNLASSLASGNTKIKGIITGPYTLSRNCINNYYKNEEEVAWAFVSILKDELRQMKNNADMIQIDEPFLSVEYSHEAKEMIHELAKVVRVPLAIHVCGDVRSIFKHLLDYNVDILDLEFVSYPKNVSLLKEYKFNKKIGFGCISIEDRRVESVRKIKRRINKALKILPPEKIIVDPDCGMRNLTRRMAFSKLKNMVTARNEILDECS
ncbi:MAG: methionine synthase [archaeon]|nr:methionine synthase [archaeon]